MEAEDEFDSFQDALPYEEPASLTSSTSTSPADGEPRAGSASSDVDALPTQLRRLKRKERLRTQSESAVWTRASLKMRPSPPVADLAATPALHGGHTPGAEAAFDQARNSESALSHLTRDMLNGLDMSACLATGSDVAYRRRSHDSSMASAIVLGSREGVINMWRQQGQISERASEILEDAKLSLHGKEKNLYDASLRRLSEAQDPRLNTLGERISSTTAAGAAHLLTEPSSTTSSAHLERASELGSSQVKADAHENAGETSARNSLPIHPSTVAARQSGDKPALDLDRELHDVDGGSPSGVDERDSNFRPQSATLYHEAVKWEGVLTRRSEWLRRLERHYYVLEGKFLRRFASKEAYLASRDEPLVPHHIQPPSDPTKPVPGSPAATMVRRNSSSPASSGVSHLYVLAGVKDSSSRANGFTFITEDKKTLQVTAPTAVEKIIWMRLGLEAIVALPTLPVAPLDMEEFYAMLVVLYTAHSGNWRTEGDMAVTLPPPSEQVFTRFFRLLDKDVIFCSNYPPSVPFHGSFRGHAGVVTFMHDFARHTLWTNFKIGGMSVDGSIAVASGKEELENRRDARKFIQNWVHKFTFYSDGRLARFEINGDVVAASAVFKVPGAATTLKLPQEFNEVDAEHGLEGVLLVRVMQGHGLKAGTSIKKTVKEPSITVHLQYREQPNQKSAANGSTPGSSTSTTTGPASLIGGISMPSLSRKFSFMTSVASSAASAASSAVGHTSSNNSTPVVDPFSTGTPRNAGDESYLPTHPVWNRVLELPFSQVIGTCSLVVDVKDHAKNGVESQLGFATLNVAKYLMAADGNERSKKREEAAMAADSKWYSISNAKGEYCGKVQLGITCRRSKPEEDDDSVQPRLKKSQSVVIDRKNPPSSNMLQWDTTPAAHSQGLLGAATPALTKGMTLDELPSEHARRHGWANVKLSPEDTARTQSAGAIVSSGKGDSDDAVHKRFPSGDSTSASLPAATDAVICKENADMHTFMVCGAPFTIPRHYQLIKVCGRGAYGIVIAATNLRTGGNVAIKKVIDCIWHPHQLKQILRECRLIRHMAHENVLSLLDLIPPPSYTDFRDVYMTVDLMEMDLHRIIYSKEVLRDDHIRYFLYQMLSGLHHMHQAGVLHRDLKPSNLLINSDCQLKICDLGLARSKEAEDVGMTEYVVTRWYRAPELLLGSAYGEGVDLWAAGCIFAEMLGRKPLFPGETYVHQLQLIMNVLGVPEEHSFKENPLANKLKGRQLLSRTQAVAGIDTSTMFPNANPEGLDLLWKMLVFDVEKRITVEEALRHPYLAMYYDEERENAPVEKFQSFDLDDLDESDLKELMFKEICHFHPEEMVKRAKQQREHPETVEKLPPGWVKRESRSVPGKFYYSNPKRGISTWIKEEMD
ncbi:CMGC/MAPK protein kinase [Phytophthora cinnamomi]|uniref:CMGC/MAPK protein kinase n=1 Tax=Phytophthora cinnamomi TaxID=4785 RepID=UPI0035597DAF|nr:CMGC/MAPK protein kinase [Phytophthora cinnamomi]